MLFFGEHKKHHSLHVNTTLTALSFDQVYSQVTVLFDNAPDLLEEFSQFLPGADGQQGSGGLFSGDLFGGGGIAPSNPQAPAAPQAGQEKSKRGGKAEKEVKEAPAPLPPPAAGGSRKKRTADKESKASARVSR